MLDGGQLEIWGRYIDELKIEDGRWKIDHRLVQVQGWKGIDELPIARVAQAQVS